MTEIVMGLQQDGSPIVRLQSEQLEVDVAPEVGGRIIGIRHRGSGYEFLWKNSRLPLELKPPGSEYDPNFYGGIDELLPNDIAETIDGVACPDHGELWTRRLDWWIDGQSLVLEGRLPLCGLTYERRMSLRADSPHVDFQYRLTNPTGTERHFLWKLHAALAVAEGDVIDCPAGQAQVVDPAYSRFGTLCPFPGRTSRASGRTWCRRRTGRWISFTCSICRRAASPGHATPRVARRASGGCPPRAD